MLRNNNSRTQNMPQDSLKRSVVYRSFVTCDDPKGVVECGSIRKLKTHSKRTENKIESQKTMKKKKKKNSNSSTSSRYKEEKEVMVSANKGINNTEDLRSPSSFQLLEVSRGAQKLNQTIDSWSSNKGFSFDGQSKDIAKDLLKGALDLQESLIMLGKLQEASQYMAKLKKKQKEKSERGRVDEVGIERTNSSRFGDQNPWLSANESSKKDCIDELKRVIGDSLARQNLLPKSTIQEKAYFDRMRLDSASEIPSTSSSQSSMVYSNNWGSRSTDSSRSSAAPEKKKAKVPNLIAKLMGVEEFPSRPSSQFASPQNQFESEKMSYHRRPAFDIEMPKARKPEFVAQKADPERRTLKEVLETMQFKGLLKGNTVKEQKKAAWSSHHSREVSWLNDDMPPIVLMKPTQFPYLESEEPFSSSKFIQKQKELDYNEKLRKLKVKEERPPTTIGREKRSLNNRRMEPEKTPIKRLRHAEGAKDSKMVVRKPEEREVRTKENACSKTKPSVPVNTKPSKEEATDKRAGISKVQKVTPTGRKPVEDSNMKPNIFSKSQDAKVTVSKPSKPENKSSIRKDRIPQQQTTSQNTRAQIKNYLHSADSKKNQIKKVKPVKEHPAENLVKEMNLECKDDDDTRINLPHEDGSVLDIHCITLANEIPAEEETEASEIENGEHCIDSQSSVSEATLLISQHEESVTSLEEESNDHKGQNEAESENFKTDTILKDLLLSSPSFHSHAEELFDLFGMDYTRHYPRISQTSTFNQLEEANAKLSLDCANELMERKSLHKSQPIQSRNLLRIRASIDSLVVEICEGFEILESYSKLGGENFSTDSHKLMLIQDLKCKEMVNAIWESGWNNGGFSMNEVQQVVAEIENLVLEELIEEVSTDFVL